MKKISELQQEIEQYFVIKDDGMLRVLLATLIGNVFDMNPLWTIFVAPSSGGKSAIITLANKIPTVKMLDDLTEKTFLSGYKIKGKEFSLLKMIGNGILMFSDFTTILTKNYTSKGEILTQLRMIYDGVFKKMTGTGEVSWKGKMGLIAGCTPVIYDELESAKSMGERFSYYEMVMPEPKEIFEKQLTNNKSDKAINEELSDSMYKYFTDVISWVRDNPVPPLKLNEKQSARLWEAADICIRGKATISRDFKTQKINKLPNISGPGRDNKMYLGYLYTLHVLRCYEVNNVNIELNDEDIDIVEKIAYSSLSRERRKVLEILAESGGQYMKASDIGTMNGFGLEGDMVNPFLHVMHAVGLVEKITGNPHRWGIPEKRVRDFINKLSKRMNRNESLANKEDTLEDVDDSSENEFDFNNLEYENTF